MRHSGQRPWLNDEFVKIEKIKSIAVSSPGNADKVDWKVIRTDENGEFALDPALTGETLDSGVPTGWSAAMMAP